MRLLLISGIAGLLWAQSDRPPTIRRKPATPPAEEKAPPEKPAAKPAEPPPENKTEPAPEQPAAPDDANYPRTQHPVKPVADPRDAGPPTLKRGAPARIKSPEFPDTSPEPTPPPPASSNAPVTVQTSRDSERTSVEQEADAEGRTIRESSDKIQPPATGDPVIGKAQERAYEFIEKLPNFICDQVTMRSVSKTLKPDWKLQDRIQVELIYVNGKEDYRNIRINGKPLKKGSPMDSGTWSTGEFGTVLADLYATNTDAQFTFKKVSEIAGVQARMYDFRVRRENSHWDIRIGRSVKPAYRGSVWIDPANGHTLRIEMNTRSLPQDYQVDTVETTIDYNWVLISGQRYLLPVKSENLACFRGTFNCTLNEIDFRNYRKFSVESQILQVESDVSYPEADDPKKPKSETIPPSITDPTIPPKTRKP